MSHRPVCVKCSREMFPKKNEVDVLHFSGADPYQLWEADLWECPACEAQIIIGFGSQPYMGNHEAGFAEKVAELKKGDQTLFESRT